MKLCRVVIPYSLRGETVSVKLAVRVWALGNQWMRYSHTGNEDLNQHASEEGLSRVLRHV